MLEHAVVAFIDFLGFRAMVEQDTKADEPVFLPLILQSLELVEDRVTEVGLGLRQFSDSVVLSSRFTPSDTASLIGTVRDLQRLLVERGISIRGGVAFGRHYDERGRLFSKALVNAYELESARARFPRVLVDPNLLDWCLNHRDCDIHLSQTIAANLKRDRDGETFVNYLDEALLGPHAVLVRNTLALGELGNASVLAKAHWLVDYHEHVAQEVGHGALDPGTSARFQPFSSI